MSNRTCYRLVAVFAAISLVFQVQDYRRFTKELADDDAKWEQMMEQNRKEDEIFKEKMKERMEMIVPIEELPKTTI